MIRPQQNFQTSGARSFQGRITTDPDKPDGTLRKLMDVSRLADMGWQAAIDLKDGIAETCRRFLDHGDPYRG